MSECVLWTKSVNTPGYGQIKVKGKNLMAHRVTWESYFGEIPGRFVCAS